MARIAKISALWVLLCIIHHRESNQVGPGPRVARLWSTRVIGDLAGPEKPAALFVNDENRAGLEFMDDQHLIVHEVDLDSKQLSSRENPLVSSSFQLRLSVFEAASGVQKAVGKWGTRPHQAGVYRTSGGILVRTASTLTQVSEDLKELRKLSFPISNVSSLSLLSVSPSGNSILVNHYNQVSSNFEVLEGTTLSLAISWNEQRPLRRLYTISDKAIVAADFNQQNILSTEFGAKKWATVAGKEKLGCVGLPTFIDDRHLVNACKRLSVIDLDGNVVYEDRLAKEQVFGNKVAASVKGRWIAVAVKQISGSDFWDTGNVRITGMQVFVYDLVARQRVLELAVQPVPQSDFDFALSPDGSKLALLNDSIVSVYIVPPA